MKKKDSNLKYSFLLVFFTVALVIQILFLIPMVVINLKMLYMVAPTLAISSMLSEGLLFVLLLVGVAYSLDKYRGK